MPRRCVLVRDKGGENTFCSSNFDNHCFNRICVGRLRRVACCCTPLTICDLSDDYFRLTAGAKDLIGHGEGQRKSYQSISKEDGKAFLSDSQL